MLLEEDAERWLYQVTSFCHHLTNYLPRYNDGAETFETADDEEAKSELKVLDDKNRNRLEKIKDLVLFRYGATGVRDAINRAVEVKKLIPVYPVKNIHNFTCDG